MMMHKKLSKKAEGLKREKYIPTSRKDSWNGKEQDGEELVRIAYQTPAQ